MNLGEKIKYTLIGAGIATAIVGSYFSGELIHHKNKLRESLIQQYETNEKFLKSLEKLEPEFKPHKELKEKDVPYIII